MHRGYLERRWLITYSTLTLPRCGYRVRIHSEVTLQVAAGAGIFALQCTEMAQHPTEPLCGALDSVVIVWEINSKMLIHGVIYQCYNVTEQK